MTKHFLNRKGSLKLKMLCSRYNVPTRSHTFSDKIDSFCFNKLKCLLFCLQCNKGAWVPSENTNICTIVTTIKHVKR